MLHRVMASSWLIISKNIMRFYLCVEWYQSVQYLQRSLNYFQMFDFNTFCSLGHQKTSPSVL